MNEIHVRLVTKNRNAYRHEDLDVKEILTRRGYRLNEEHLPSFHGAEGLITEFNIVKRNSDTVNLEDTLRSDLKDLSALRNTQLKAISVVSDVFFPSSRDNDLSLDATVYNKPVPNALLYRIIESRNVAYISLARRIKAKQTWLTFHITTPRGLHLGKDLFIREVLLLDLILDCYGWMFLADEQLAKPTGLDPDAPDGARPAARRKLERARKACEELFFSLS